MRYLRGLRLTVGLQLGLLLMLFFASNALGHAQSCALCYTQAASASHRLIRGLRTGILILIVPPVFLSVGITLLAYKKRNWTNDKRDLGGSGDEW